MQHILVVPGFGDVVVFLHWPVDYTLNGVTRVVDEDDGGSEVVANYRA